MCPEYGTSDFQVGINIVPGQAHTEIFMAIGKLLISLKTGRQEERSLIPSLYP
jgi:hypothetical protein